MCYSLKINELNESSQAGVWYAKSVAAIIAVNCMPYILRILSRYPRSKNWILPMLCATI